MRCLRLLAIGACSGAVLIGCTMQEERKRNTEGGMRTISAASVAAEEIVASSGAVLTERLLPTGILEVGDPSAPLVLLHFTNMSCRPCREFFRELLPVLQPLLSARTLRLRIVPFLLRIYPESAQRARELVCAAAQGRGWSTAGAQLNGAARFDAETVVDGLDRSVFAQCLTATGSGIPLALQQGFADSLAVTAVPTSFLNGQRIVGVPDRADFARMLKDALP